MGYLVTVDFVGGLVTYIYNNNNLLHQNDVHMGRENMKMKRNEIVQRGGGAEGRCEGENLLRLLELIEIMQGLETATRVAGHYQR